MIICPKCNRQLDDGAKFCDGCGEKIPQSVSCPSCGKQMSEGFAFCQYCGAKLDAMQPVPAAVAAVSVSEQVSNAAPSSSAPASMPVQTAMPTPAPTPTLEQTAMPCAPMAQPAAVAPVAAAVKKPFPKKVVLFGGIGLAVVALIVILIVIIAGSGNALGDNFTIYAKDDGELYLNKFSGDPWQITERLSAPSNGDIAEAAYQIGQYITVSKDGKTIFYPDRLSNSSNGMALFYREINSEDDGVRIDTSVTRYSINDSATVVTYIKAGDNNLYQYDVNSDEKSKIDSDVTFFYVSDNGKKIVYYNDDNSIYFYNSNSDSREKIDSDAIVRYCSDDLTTLYYTKDNNLYKKVEGEDKVKIASDVLTVYKVYDSGEIYYIKLSEDSSVSLINYVEDDMKDADALITEPKYPDYPDYPVYPSYPSNRPYRFNFDSQEKYENALEGYNKAVEKYEEEVENYNKEVEKLREEYDRAVDKYYDDYDKYWDKVSRDSLRESLENTTLDHSTNTLYYYDGTEEKELSSSYDEIYGSSSDAAAVVFTAYKRDSLPSIKLSEVQSTYDVSERVNAALFSEIKYNVAVKDTINVLEGRSLVKIDSNGERLYYASYEEESSAYNLYSAAISDGVVQTPELYDTDIISDRSWLLDFFNGKITYWKDYDNGKGDLYVEKERVDYDVDYSSVRFDADLDIITYMTDIDSKGKGTLKIYKNGSAEKISDDVSDYCVLPNGKILYLYDYNTNRNRGELHVYNNGKTEKVDDDVVAVFQITDGKYKGYYWY